MKTKEFIYAGLVAVFLILAWNVLNLFAQTGTKYRSELRGDHIVLEVKTKVTAICPGQAVKWDDNGIVLLTSGVLANNHATPDSIADRLSQRGSVWKVVVRPYGCGATDDTVTVYGLTISDDMAWYTTTGASNVSTTKPMIFKGADFTASDTNYMSTEYYTRIDSIRYQCAGTSGDSVTATAYPFLPYVEVCDSANVREFAGIVTDSVELDTTGYGTDGTVGSGVGKIAILGFARAIVTGTPGDEIDVGDYLCVSTSAGFLKKASQSLAAADTFLADSAASIHYVVRTDSAFQQIKTLTETYVAKAFERCWFTNDATQDTIVVEVIKR